MPSREKLAEFTAWRAKHITGDEKGQAQIFLDHLFQAFGQPSSPDTTVLTAYGSNAKKDLLAQLLALNQQVAANIEHGASVMPPGVPKNFPDAKQLVTEDCIRPSVAS